MSCRTFHAYRRRKMRPPRCGVGGMPWASAARRGALMPRCTRPLKKQCSQACGGAQPRAVYNLPVVRGSSRRRHGGAVALGNSMRRPFTTPTHLTVCCHTTATSVDRMCRVQGDVKLKPDTAKFRVVRCADLETRTLSITAHQTFCKSVNNSDVAKGAASRCVTWLV